MKQNISIVSLVVADYDEAIHFFTEKLGFELRTDTILSPEKRWVVVAPKGSPGSGLLLAKATSPHQLSRVGDQTGGRVFLLLETDDFDRDFAALKHNGVKFSETPREEEYGKVAVFEDLYGNRWDLIEYRLRGS